MLPYQLRGQVGLRNGPLLLEYLTSVASCSMPSKKHVWGIPACSLRRWPVQCAMVPSPNDSIQHNCHWSALDVDAALVAHTPENLRGLLDRLAIACTAIGLKVSDKKTVLIYH